MIGLDSLGDVAVITLQRQAARNAIDGAMTAAVPEGHDVVFAANLIHYWSPDQNKELLRRIRAAVETVATLLVADPGPTPPTPRRCTPL